jgi:hypothetical protein
MKKTHKYNTNFSEYKKALKFLKKGCECGCSKKVPPEEFAQLRSDFQSLPKAEQDAFVMAHLFIMRDREKISTSPRLKKKERTNQRFLYLFDYKIPICQETYINMLGISEKYLKTIKKHLANQRISSRTHGNLNKTPQWATKMTIDQNIKKKVKKFLEKYAQEHGQPDPSQKYARKIAVEVRSSGEIILLPTYASCRSVHDDFVISFEKDDKLKSLKYEAFRRLWHELVPHIKFMKPRTDLCDLCHEIKNEIHSCKDEKVKQELKNSIDTN